MAVNTLTCGDCGRGFDSVDDLLDHDCSGRNDDPGCGGAGALVADGAGECGNRSCDDPAPYTVAGDTGGYKARCFQHALEHVDGLGAVKAERIAGEFDDLEALCENIKHGSSPRIAGLAGFSPDTAADLKSALQDAGLWHLPATDGGVDTAAWYDLRAFQRDILRSVHALDDAAGMMPYGLAVKRELEARYDEQVNHGRLYPNLDELVQNDVLAKSDVDDRTNRYDLTHEGRALLESALAEDADLLANPGETSAAEPARADGGQDGGEN